MKFHNSVPLKIGHRGASGTQPENTLAAIATAFALNADGVEIDVHRCKSGELVVIHDDTVERTTNGHGAVADFTLQQLQNLIIAPQHRIPTLQNVLDILPADKWLNIELKGANTARAVADLLDENAHTGRLQAQQLVISSFDWQQLRSFQNAAPDLRVGLLTIGVDEKVIEAATKMGAYSIHPHHECMRRALVEPIRENGLQVWTWGLNENAEIARAKAFAVDAIITDFPDRI